MLYIVYFQTQNTRQNLNYFITCIKNPKNKLFSWIFKGYNFFRRHFFWLSKDYLKSRYFLVWKVKDKRIQSSCMKHSYLEEFDMLHLLNWWVCDMYISNNFSSNWNRLERFYSLCLCKPRFLIKSFYFNDPIKHPEFDEERL